MPGRRIEKWPIHRLRDHHQQAAMFHDLECAEFDDLVASIRLKGIEHPLEVTPDGTIIDGHQRKRVAELLGWTEVPVEVCDDLAGDDVAIDLAHARANKTRRQLDALDRVRLERRVMELERGRRWADVSENEKQLLRDEMCKRHGYSDRHVKRLINILTTPMPVQKAVSKGRLPLVKADRVSRLSWPKQTKIVEEIEAGGEPAEIVDRYLTARRRPPKADVAYRRLMADVERALDDLEGREAEINWSGPKAERDLAVFERLGRLRENVEAMLERRSEEWRRSREDAETDLGFLGDLDGLDTAVA
jgi:ParB-like chromosome segregation protein Spo0J